jgi:hypothetical protein
MANKLSATETIELNKFKSPEVPNLSQDDVAKAMQEARDKRNASRREAAREQSKFFHKDVEDSVQNFNERNNIVETEVTNEEDTVVETRKVQSEDTIEEIDEESANQKITRLVNGRKVTKTLGEWMAQATKVEDADGYLSQAVSHLQRTTAPKIETPVVETVDDLPYTVEDEDFVAALQTGTKDEAVEALRKRRLADLKKQNEANTLAATRSRVNAIQSKLEADNPDIFKDTVLKAVFFAKDKELVDGKTFMKHADMLVNFEERLGESIKQTRDWLANTKGTAVRDVKKEELIEKKKKLLNIKGSNSKVEETVTNKDGVRTFGATDDDSAQESYKRYVAEQMRKKRKVMN